MRLKRPGSASATFTTNRKANRKELSVSGLSNLWSKLDRSKKYREAFVASQLKRGIPTQLRVLLKQRGWSQADLAERSGLTQGAISRAADPDYGNLTFNNVLKIAGGFDIAFVGKFVRFSDLASWHDSITDEEALMVDSFGEDTEPQTKKSSFAAALTEHVAAPAPLDLQSELGPGYPMWIADPANQSWARFIAMYSQPLVGEGLGDSVREWTIGKGWQPVPNIDEAEQFAKKFETQAEAALPAKKPLGIETGQTRDRLGAIVGDPLRKVIPIDSYRPNKTPSLLFNSPLTSNAERIAK
jgi:transcriptional regulator with XRE-family HTH domain